jgi:outer membrane protein assembly factor BamB
VSVRRLGCRDCALFALAPTLLALFGACTGKQQSSYGLEGTERLRSGAAVIVRWTLPLDPAGERYVPVEQAAPAVDPEAGRVYVGSTEGTLWALDADDGKKRYGYRANAAIEAQPVVDPQRDEVYAATVTGQVLALHGASGALRWKAEADGSISQPALLSEDAVYVVTDTDLVVAFARTDGKVLWRYRREPHEGFAIAGHAGLALAGSRLLTGFGDGVVVALDSSDGRLLWESDTSVDLEDLDPTRRFTDVDTTPLVVGDTVYVASFSGGLYALELDSGGVRAHEGALIGVTGLTATEDALIIASAERGVVCLDLPALSLRWQRALPGGAPSLPLVRGDRVYVSESLGALLALALADGRELGRLQTRHGFTAPAMLDGHRGFALSNAGTLYAFVY